MNYNYILPHLGLGDYLLLNGLIRNIVKKEGKYILFVNNRYKKSISFMFRDLKNLDFSFIPPVNYNNILIKIYIKHSPYKLFMIGYENFKGDIPFDQSCYRQFNVDFNKRWLDFYVDRDIKQEKKLFNHFNVKENNYIFLHEGGSENGRFIDRNQINSDLPLVKVDPSLTDNIFDYCYLIEHAAEIHCIESSFVFLCESILTNGKLFVYRSDAGKLLENQNTLPTYKKNWIIK